MFLAIVNNKVVSVARDPVTADKEAEKKYPGKPFLVTYIPKSKEEVQLMSTNPLGFVYSAVSTSPESHFLEIVLKEKYEDDLFEELKEELNRGMYR